MKGVATAGQSSVSLNFGLADPFVFDVNEFEMGLMRDALLGAVPAGAVSSQLSDYYLRHPHARPADTREETTQRVWRQVRATAR